MINLCDDQRDERLHNRFQYSCTKMANEPLSTGFLVPGFSFVITIFNLHCTNTSFVNKHARQLELPGKSH